MNIQKNSVAIRRKMGQRDIAITMIMLGGVLCVFGFEAFIIISIILALGAYAQRAEEG